MGDKVFDPVEKVAEAMADASNRVLSDEDYAALARAVIDALGLTEETRMLDEGMGGGTATFARLVGPWREQ